MLSTIGTLVALAASLLLAAPPQTRAAGFASGVCAESPHVSDRPSGCWQIDAAASGASLRLVVRIP